MGKTAPLTEGRMAHLLYLGRAAQAEGHCSSSAVREEHALSFPLLRLLYQPRQAQACGAGSSPPVGRKPALRLKVGGNRSEFQEA